MLASVVTLAATLLLTAAWSDLALAHGPCGCLDPRVVQAAGQVRIVGENFRESGAGYPAYRVIFNPRPADLGIAPAYLAGAFRADAPSKTVLARPRTRATRRGRFRVPPDAPPGLYMVLIFDGGEGGAHNTWDYLHVFAGYRDEPSGVITEGRGGGRPAGQTRTPSPARSADASDGVSGAWPFIVLAAIGGLALGVGGGRRFRQPGK